MASDAAALIDAQRREGFDTTHAASDALEAVRTEVEASDDSELRRNYHVAVASVNLSAERPERAAHAQAGLERLAKDAGCTRCAHSALVVRLLRAAKSQDSAESLAALERLEAVAAPGDPGELQQMEFAKSLGHFTAGNYAAAVEHGLQSVGLAAQLGWTAEQARALILLALANAARGDLDHAMTFADEAYALSERIGFRYLMVHTRGNQAWLHSLAGNRQQQFVFVTEQLKLVRELGMREQELPPLISLADYHLSQRQFGKAIPLSDEAIKLATALKQPRMLAVAMLNKAMALDGLGQLEESIAGYRAGIRLLEQVDARSVRIDALEALADLFERNGRPAEALQTLREAVALRQQSAAQERTQATAEAQEKFLAERKDREIERLSLENARRLAEAEAASWEQRLWAATAVALALAAVLLVQVVRRARSRARRLEADNAALADQSAHDPLTGVFNRRHLTTLMSPVQGAPPSNGSVSRVGLMLLDVDHFKSINDRFGHVVGDQVLVEVARRLQELVRQHDAVVRLGGEEFVLVLPGTGPAGMAVLVERLLHRMSAEPVWLGNVAIPVTVSAGCVAHPLGTAHHWEGALQVADHAMYLAKQRGRNRAICVTDLGDNPRYDLVQRGDLEDAERVGQVSLKTIEGAATAHAQHSNAGPGSDGVEVSGAETVVLD
ncbi:MAG TPA: tetratricopeptide repeat-containing diguanylate cyclase, partial [Pseudoxanthomonas sp.]|nr:tetratricopeptide repeat-containing diguanylate cyclase [Pseudoxanthomonas sp.]